MITVLVVASADKRLNYGTTISFMYRCERILGLSRFR